MRRWLFALLVCLAPVLARADIEIPPLQHRVTDLTGTLTVQQQSDLEANLVAFEARKGSQIAILMVPTTQPEDIAQYSIRVVEAWKLGRKGVGDGVLVLLAKDDHKSRIEVGYGLEGALNDATAKRILSEVMRPYLKQGDFYGGLVAGVSKIETVIDGEPLLVPESQSGKGGLDAFNYAIPIFFAAMVLGGLLRAMLGSFVGGMVNGGLVGILLWALGTGLIFAIFFGIVAFFMTLGGGMRAPGSFSSGGMGGGFGGGGFSGGGGSFGGGGASGDW